jgi:hypothetical protein
MVITQVQFNTAMKEINEAFGKLSIRVAALEDAVKASEKPAPKKVAAK